MTDTDEDGRTMLNEDGQVKTRMVSMFPFRWWKAHFLTNPRDYFYEDEDMDAQDKEAHAALCRYVEILNPTQWMTRTREPVFDEKGEFVWEARVINT